MPLTLDATVGGANANSYLTLLEAQAYWESRLFTAPWDSSADQTAALVWATRTIDALSGGYKYLVPPTPGVCECAYYRTMPMWTGLPASTTQALAWPRTGMFDRNGNAIPSTVIPQALKDAVAELAGRMSTSDRTIDSDISVQGITSIKAGPIALTFKDSIETLKVLPDYVTMLLVSSWLTDEIITPAWPALFDVI